MTLLDNYQQYQEAVKISENSEGQANEKYKAYLESIEYQLQRLKATWEELAQSLGATDFMKDILKGANWLLERLPALLQLVTKLVLTVNNAKIPTWLDKAGKYITGKTFSAVTANEEMAKAKTEKFLGARKAKKAEKKDAEAKIEALQSKADDAKIKSENADAAVKAKQEEYNKAQDDLTDKTTKQAEATEALTKAQEEAAKQAKQAQKVGQKKGKKSKPQTDQTNSAAAVTQAQADLDNANAAVEEAKKKKEETEKELAEAETEQAKAKTEAEEAESKAKEATTETADRERELAEEEQKTTANAIKIGITQAAVQGATAYLMGNSTTGDMLWKDVAKDAKKGSFFYNASQVNSLEASTADRAINAVSGVTSGIGAGLMATGSGWGIAIGIILQALDSLGVATFIKGWINSDKINRQDRIKTANKVIDAMGKVSQAIDNGLSLSRTQFADYTQEDYRKTAEITEEFKKALWDENAVFEDKFGNVYSLSTEFEKNLGGMGLTAVNATEALNMLSSGTKEASTIIAAYAAAQKKMQAYATYASHEQDIIDLNKELNSEQSLMAGRYNVAMQEGDESKARQIAEKYFDEYNENIDVARQIRKSKQSQLTAYEDERAQTMLEAAALESGISGMTSLEIGNATLDRIKYQIAAKAQEENIYGWNIFDANGQLTSEYDSMITQYLRNNDDYQPLFGSSTKFLGQYAGSASRNKRSELINAFGGKSYSDIMKIASSNNEGDTAEIKRISAQFGMDPDRFRDYINNLDPSKITSFANKLGYATGQFTSDLIEEFSWLSDADLMGSADDLRKKFEDLSNVANELIQNGHLTQETINSLAASNPYLLIGEGGNISQDNVLSNMLKMTYGANPTLKKAIADFTAAESRTNQQWWNVFKMANGDAIREQYKGDTETLNRFESSMDAMSFMDVLTAEGNGDLMTQWQETVAGLTGVVDYMTQLQDAIVQYEQKMMDNEIDNLQSIKENLDSNNDAREKEIALIKAKDKLENAKNEKKRVYRAGLGFVYESDAQAVKDAQDEVEKAKKAIESENVQYQIDVLQQQKQLLSDIKNQAQWDNLKGVVDQIHTLDSKIQDKLDNASILSEDWASHIGGFFDNSATKKAILEEVKKAVEGQFTNVASEEHINARQDFIDKFKNVNDAYTAYQAAQTRYGENSTQAKNAKTNYNAAVSALSKSYSNASSLGVTKDEISEKAKDLGITGFEFKVGGKTVTITPQELWNQGANMSKIADTEIYAPTSGNMTAAGREIWNGGIGLEDYADTAETVTSEGIKYVNYPTSNELIYFNPNKMGNEVTSGSEFEKVSKNYQFTPGSQDWKPNVTFAEFKQNAPSGSLLLNSKSDRMIIKSGNDVRYAYVYKAYDGLFRTELQDANDSANGKTTTGYVSQYGDYYSWMHNGERVPPVHYLFGTTNSPTGVSLLNEVGTEAIVTPSGTITALPSHSGVVPADLTKSLYDLGTVAPNLIKHAITTSNFATNSNVKTEDNSTNIDTLYATFDTDKDFDVNQFLTNIRSVVNTTAHAH